MEPLHDMFYDKPVLDVLAIDPFLYEFVETVDRASGEPKVVIRWTHMNQNRSGVIGGLWPNVEAAIAYLNKPVTLPVP